jgi:hypothetical protein
MVISKFIISVKGGHCVYLQRHCSGELSETNLAGVLIPICVPISHCQVSYSLAEDLEL